MVSEERLRGYLYWVASFFVNSLFIINNIDMYSINITSIGHDLDRLKAILIQSIKDIDFEDKTIHIDSTDNIGVSALIEIEYLEVKNLRTDIGLS